MQPHDFEDYRPPPQKPENDITGTDLVMIALTTFGLYSSVLVASMWNFLLVVVAWRLYERYRSGKL
tara:strand:- start:162 stop:359 length:198 start_codon:yes stop_codon:yes gene_type:complete